MNGNPQEDERELMGETGTLFRDLGRNFKVTSCDVATIWPDIYIYICISNHLYTSCMAHKFENQFHNMQRCEMYNVCLFVVTKGCGSPETLEQSDPLFVD